MTSARKTITKIRRLLVNYTKFLSSLSYDVIGPLAETRRGNKHIITITDSFSKWAEAGPLPDKRAHGIAKFLCINLILTRVFIGDK